MNLADKVYLYYTDNSHLLTDDKRFHFGSRMAAWRGDKIAFDMLRQSRDFIVQPEESLSEVIAELVNSPQSGKRNAHELRQPFFDKYPQLYGVHLALFRVRHLESIYGIDAREALYAAMPKQALIELRDALLADKEAMRILSTFAINFLYLLDRIILKDENSLPLDYFYELGKGYDTNNIYHLQLLIYLYTHCIIGESNFYTRMIPDDKLAIYHKMLKDLEDLIALHFDEINLDNKLEFLTCARICRFETKLYDRVYKECEHSISPDGTFIIDVHNKNVQDERNDFIRSEHRNVLFLMSSSPYEPHSTLL